MQRHGWPTLLTLRTGHDGRKILDLLRQGISYNAIVAEVGCSKSTINHYALAQCKRHFGFSSDAWDKAVERGELVPNPWRIPLEALLVSGRTTDRGHLKGRLFDAGVLEQHCHECGLVEWRGKKLPLELHHIKGIHDDNRRENLTLLCPNCHILTPNYCGKNTKRRKTGIR